MESKIINKSASSVAMIENSQGIAISTINNSEGGDSITALRRQVENSSRKLSDF